MSRALAALVAVALAVWACTVDTKTDKLACKTSADCSGGRTCQAGYCVIGGPIDAANIDARPIDAAVCPPACTSCDFATGTCNITGAGSGSSITCPAGWGCAITCTETTACGDITCGTGACNVTCTGSGACAAIACASSCRCDVSCNPALTACGNMMCPMHANKLCVQNAVPFPCDSSVAPQCRTCP